MREMSVFSVRTIFLLCVLLGCGGDSFTVEADHGDQSSNENEGASISISGNSADGGTVISSNGSASIATRRYDFLVVGEETATFCLESVPPTAVVRISTPGLAVVEIGEAACASATINPESTLQMSAPAEAYSQVFLDKVDASESLFSVQTE